MTSIEAVQRALHESGNASLGEALANNLAEQGSNLANSLADRLHLPRRAATAAETAEAAATPPAPPPEEPRTQFELILKEELPPWFTPYPFVLTSYRRRASTRAPAPPSRPPPHHPRAPLAHPSRTPRAPLAPEWPPSPRRRGVVPCSDFSYRLCVASLFRLHNETFNVWSELAPAVCFAVWTARFLD